MGTDSKVPGLQYLT